MGGGLSIGPSAPKRRIGQEWPQIRNLFGSSENQLNKFVGGQPLLGIAEELGMGFSSGVGALTKPIASFMSPLTSAFNKTVNPTLQSGGALTPQETRDITQATDTSFAARGMGRGNQAITSEFLNRQNYQQQRFNEALGQAGTIEGIESGAAGQIQGLQSGAINEAIAPESAAISGYNAITDPLLTYAGNLFSGNQAAQLSQQQANTNKGAGLVGGSSQGVGSILSTLALAGVISDKKLKTKIKDTGAKGAHGIPIKTFQFKGDPDKTTHIGYIADDVEKIAPHAVFKDQRGFKRVNFSALHGPQAAQGMEGSIPYGLLRETTYGPGSPHATKADRREHIGIRNIHLRQGDVALQPRTAKRFGIKPGENFTYGGKTYRYADNPAPKVGNVLDVFFPGAARVARTVGHVPMAVGRTAGRIPGRVGRTIVHQAHRTGFHAPGQRLGRSGFPRAIPVKQGAPQGRGKGPGKGRGHPNAGDQEPGSMGPSSHAFMPDSFGGFPLGSGPPSSLTPPVWWDAGSNTPPAGPPPGQPAPGQTTPGQTPDLSSMIPWIVPDTPIDFITDPWGTPGYTGEPIGAEYGGGGGIQ